MSANGMVRRRGFIICNSAPCCAFEIVILPAFERPEKAQQPGEPEPERQRHKDDKDFHQDLPRAARRARRAFSITSSDEPDMATAAISGVTNPTIAIGTARRLYPTATQSFCRISCKPFPPNPIAPTTRATV